MSDALKFDWIERGDGLREERRWLDAATAYGHALEHEIGSQHLWVQYAHLLKEGELFPEALFAYGAAIRCDGTQPDPQLHRAHLLKGMGRLPEALEAFRRLAQLPYAPHVEQEIAGLSVALVQEKTPAAPVIRETDASVHPACMAGFLDLRRLEADRMEQIARENKAFSDAGSSGAPVLAEALSELRLLTDRRGLKARLVPKADLVIEDGRFVATTDKPQFSVELDGQPLRPGWYAIDITINTPGGAAEPLLFLELERDWARFSAVRLGRKDETAGPFGAIFLVEAPVMRLRFDPMRRAGSFAVENVSLRQISMVKATREAFRRHPKAARAALSEMRPHGDGRFARGIADILRLPPPDRYHAFLTARDVETDDRIGREQRAAARWSNPPRLFLIIDALDGPSAKLEASLAALTSQSYAHWQACLVLPATLEAPGRAKVLRLCADDPRLLVEFVEPDGTLQALVSRATGAFVCVLRAGDRVASSALYLIAQRLVAKASTRLLYADEDRISATAGRCQPQFKPDWDPDYVFATNYTGRFIVVDAALLDATSVSRRPLSQFDSFALTLEATETLDAGAIAHVAQVLFHGMTDGPQTADEPILPALTADDLSHLRDSLSRRGDRAEVAAQPGGFIRVTWPLPDPAPLVTLVIPTRDSAGMLKDCIDSILTVTDYPQIEIVVVDNGSVETETLAYFDRLSRQENIRVLPAPGPFNFAHLNNIAVAEAKGSVIGLINNDILAIEAGWLRKMVSHAVRPAIGAVGAKLLYRSGHVQHAGIALGIGTVAGHPFKFKNGDEPGYMGRLAVTQTLSAVTAACLVVEKAKYIEVGGLDADRFKVAFNDVDFCLKLDAAGYRNIFTPHARLVHLESVTRGLDTTPEKVRRYLKEADAMLDSWEPRVARDPYYNIHLSRSREDYSLDD